MSNEALTLEACAHQALLLSLTRVEPYAPGGRSTVYLMVFLNGACLSGV